jgi:hypothetical protein
MLTRMRAFMALSATYTVSYQGQRIYRKAHPLDVSMGRI